MGRILFWILLGIAGYLAWRWWRANLQQLRGPRAGDSSGGATSGRTGEKMIACEVCGLNVPQSEAVPADGRWYCCEEHRRRAG
jgi:uncharacterized protein